MRKLLVALLATGLLLLGVTPVWAAGQAMAAAVPAQQDEVVQVVVPEGVQATDQFLDETSGQGLGAALLNGLREGLQDAIKAGGTTYLVTRDKKTALKVAAAAFAMGFIVGAAKGLLVPEP